MRKQEDTPKRNRTEQIKFWTTPEEKELILQKMELYGTSNMGAYLRKMAIDGYAQQGRGLLHHGRRRHRQRSAPAGCIR